MREGRRRGTVLVISQTYVPDPASVGQHMHDAAAELARRGWDVVVLASERGFENPTHRYPRREDRDGVHIRRLPFASFGKATIFHRMLGTISFLFQTIFVAFFTPGLAGILFSTSPPMIGAAVTVVRMFRRVPTAYWAMDLNPDQVIAMGKAKASSPVIQVVERVNRMILANSDVIVALDRFMRDRLRPRLRPGVIDRKTIVLPPWPHEQVVEPLAHSANTFRDEHGLQGKFVVMYSGNHSIANPLDTLLAAALHFRDDPMIVFAFIGGGLQKRDVNAFIETHQLKHVLSLPYQPLERLRYSLSAADVHVVSLGDEMVGIIHPCKVYGAMAVGRPILFFGPRPSHVSDLLETGEIGLHVSHGDVQGAIAAIEQLRATPPRSLQETGRRAQTLLAGSLSQPILCGRMMDAVEEAFIARARD